MASWLTNLSGILLAGVPLMAQAPSVEPVLQAELAFARMADQKGIRTAFRTWLRDDAKVFVPRMTTAREHYDPEPGDPGHLGWYPEAMGIAHSGDLAWSFGPWTYAAKKGEAPLVQGHFLSLWRRQSTGLWKVVADIGVPHASPVRPIEPFAVRDASSAAETASAQQPDASQLLRKKEADLAAAWAETGGAALAPDLAKAARVLRRGAFPAQAAADIQKVLAADRPGGTWEPGLIQVAPSGDLAWTCGETRPDKRGDTASYLRIWTLEAGAWKVLFDVRLPHPSPTK